MSTRVTTSPDSASGGADLRRAVGGRLLLLFVIGDVLDAGIYTFVGEAAGGPGVCGG